MLVLSDLLEVYIGMLKTGNKLGLLKTLIKEGLIKQKQEEQVKKEKGMEEKEVEEVINPDGESAEIEDVEKLTDLLIQKSKLEETKLKPSKKFELLKNDIQIAEMTEDSDLNGVLAILSTYVSKCKMEDLFRDNGIGSFHGAWKPEWTQKIVDPCMIDVINEAFEFSDPEVEFITKSYDSKTVSESLVYFVKGFVLKSTGLVSPFWARSKAFSKYNKYPPGGKDDDMTIVAVIVDDEKAFSKEEEHSRRLIDEKIRIKSTTMIESNLLSLKHDVLFLRAFPPKINENKEDLKKKI